MHMTLTSILAPILLFAGSAIARPDMDAGRLAFTASCASCHSLKRGEVLQGPSLAGVYGRRAGSLAEFNYSDAMRGSGVIWLDSALDEYISSPFMAMGGGIKMMAHGIRDEATRANLIEFLKRMH